MYSSTTFFNFFLLNLVFLPGHTVSMLNIFSPSSCKYTARAKRFEFFVKIFNFFKLSKFFITVFFAKYVLTVLTHKKGFFLFILNTKKITLSSKFFPELGVLYFKNKSSVFIPFVKLGNFFIIIFSTN